jgi:formimidoylglutamate deiminase
MAMLDDLTRLARSGATVALAPTTEANFGDGLFSLDWYLHRNGVIVIGSDSNVSVDVREELRWLEYGQRTSKRQRTIAPQLAGETLYRAALKGGAASLGRRCGVIAASRRSPHDRAR